jgi:hypothetical protein
MEWAASVGRPIVAQAADRLPNDCVAPARTADGVIINPEPASTVSRPQDRASRYNGSSTRKI